MNPAIILKLVLLLGVVLLVVAIGTRARLEEPLLLLRRPALALRTMLAMYGALPAFVLLLVWLLPLRLPACSHRATARLGRLPRAGSNRDRHPFRGRDAHRANPPLIA